MAVAEVLLCAACGGQVAAGAPRCPACPSTVFTPAAPPPIEVDDAGAQEKLAAVAGKLGQMADAEPDGPQGAEEAPADEPQAPDAAPGPAPDPPAAPRTPPRRSA